MLVADLARFERVATLRPIRLPGGDQAIREVWRIALALVDDAFEGKPPLERIPLFRGITGERLAVVRQMIASGLNAPLAHGAGRYFDALGALGLGLPESRHEGQVALAWNLVADPAEHRRYGYRLDRSCFPWTLDLRSMVQEAVADIIVGRPPSSISGAFHNTLAHATAAMVRAVLAERGRMPVVLTGGCFQNAAARRGCAHRAGSTGRRPAPSPGSARRRWHRAGAGPGGRRGLARSVTHVSGRSGSGGRGAGAGGHRRLLGRAQAGAPRRGGRTGRSWATTCSITWASPSGACPPEEGAATLRLYQELLRIQDEGGPHGGRRPRRAAGRRTRIGGDSREPRSPSKRPGSSSSGTRSGPRRWPRSWLA